MTEPLQLSDGKARLLTANLRDPEGGELLVAQQGQEIEVVATFEALADLGHPGSGLELRDAAGSMVHGTSTFLHETELAPALRKGGRVTFRHRLRLDVLPGDYAIVVAIATVALDVPYRDASVGHDEFFAHVTEHCRLEAPMPLTVLAHPRGKLDHYGLVGLPGAGSTSVEFD